MRLALYLAIYFTASPLLCAQSSEDAAWQLTVRLSQVRRQAAKALKEQPDFTCLATFDRFRMDKKVDTVRVEVAYVGGRELYSWPGEGKFSETPLSSMVGAGLMGDGDFAVHAHNLFVFNNGTEKWAGEEPAAGRWGATDKKLWRWDYRISHYQSGWVINSSGIQQTVGSEGSFWVDPQTLDLVRMETRATDFLPNFPLAAVESSVEYGRVSIGGQQALLPLRAELKTTTPQGAESRNLTEYTNCRQYAGQSTISFAAPAEEPAVTPAAPPPTRIAEARLPAGLALKIRLSQNLDLGRTMVGDAIEGTLDMPLRDGKKEFAPKGATVRGRVRLLTRDSTKGRLPGSPIEFVELGLVFDELQFSGHLQPFTAQLKSFDTLLPGVRMTLVQDREASATGITREQITPTRFPGASVFFVDSRSNSLPKGMLMTWTTLP
jgi:hypothetical protein